MQRIRIQRRQGIIKLQDHEKRKPRAYEEFMLYAIGRKINKYHRFLHYKIDKSEGKTKEITA